MLDHGDGTPRHCCSQSANQFLLVFIVQEVQQDGSYLRKRAGREEHAEERRSRRAGGGEQAEESRRRRAGGGEQAEESRWRRAGGGEQAEESRRRRAGGGEQAEESKPGRANGGEHVELTCELAAGALPWPEPWAWEESRLRRAG
jgi:hypothetical protein